MEHQYQNDEQHENILDEIGPHLVLASAGKRFGNYIIDAILFRVISYIILVLIMMVWPQALYEFFGNNMNLISLYLFAFVSYALYTAIAEKLGRGASLGKLITGTRVVTHEGHPVTWSHCLRRGFCRLVPFEFLSGFSGYMWHDQWTDTYVIDVKKSRL